MKKQTHPHLLIRASVLWPLVLTIWPPSQARSAGASERENLPEEKITESQQPGNEQKPKTNENGVTVRGFVQDIGALAIKNGNFRQVLYTARNCQLVVMALKPGEDIGAEVHQIDQVFRVEEGSGEAVLDGVRTAIRAGFAVLVPAGTKHNIINTGSGSLKLYTLYAPPYHRDGVVHPSRRDAEADSEHFDGKTTE